MIAVKRSAGRHALTTTHDDNIATVERDETASAVRSEVANTRDVLTFQGRTPDDLRTAFADTVAGYID